MGLFIRSCFCSKRGCFGTFAGFENAFQSRKLACNLPVAAKSVNEGAALGPFLGVANALPGRQRAVRCGGAVQPCRLQRCCCRQRLARHRRFRSCFDSSQARKTVRWGRFWGLLFAPENGASGAWRVRLAFCGPSVNRLDRPAGRFGGKRLFWPFFAASHAPQASLDFAPALIAAKPEKPCDGGVFGGFYSLPKKERRCVPTGWTACVFWGREGVSRKGVAIRPGWRRVRWRRRAR